MLSGAIKISIGTSIEVYKKQERKVKEDIRSAGRGRRRPLSPITSTIDTVASKWTVWKGSLKLERRAGSLGLVKPCAAGTLTGQLEERDCRLLLYFLLLFRWRGVRASVVLTCMLDSCLAEEE